MAADLGALSAWRASSGFFGRGPKLLPFVFGPRESTARPNPNVVDELKTPEWEKTEWLSAADWHAKLPEESAHALSFLTTIDADVALVPGRKKNCGLYNLLLVMTGEASSKCVRRLFLPVSCPHAQRQSRCQ